MTPIQPAHMSAEDIAMRFGIVRSLVFGLSLTCILTAGVASADPPADWGGGGQDYELLRDEAMKHGGKASGSVKFSGGDGNTFGTLTQGFRADKFRGKRLRMSGLIKTEAVEGWVGLWMRVDGKDKTGIAFDNMQDRKVNGTADWKKYELVLEVPDNAEEIYFGFLVAGKGQGWVDDVVFEEVGKDVATTGPDVQPMDRVADLSPDLPKEPKNLDFEK
jgi:hypothetical protein